MIKLLPKAAALAASLLLPACAASVTQVPLTVRGAEKAFRTVPVYTKAPCWMQRKWSGHNSAYETLRQKKEVVYKPPCDVDKPKGKKTKSKAVS